MRLIMSAVVFAAASFGLMPASSADSSRSAVTSWIFRVAYSTGQYSDSTDPAETGSVLMYTGASWRCSRDAVTLNNAGFMVGGFSCGQPAGTGQVFVTAGCAATSDYGDHASAMISDATAKGYMRLTVSCTTKVPVRPAASKSAAAIEKDL